MTSKIALVATFKMIADFRNKIGTKPTFWNVRYLIAIGGKADMTRTFQHVAY
jgi:hypothetical protein